MLLYEIKYLTNRNNIYKIKKVILMKKIILTIIVLVLTILNIVLFRNYFINLQVNEMNDYNIINDHNLI